MNAKRKWTFCNLGKWCCPNFRPSLPYERKRHSRKEIWQRQGILKWKCITSGWRALLKSVFALTPNYLLPNSLHNLHAKFVLVLAHRYLARKPYTLKSLEADYLFLALNVFFFIITPLPFLLCLNSVISLLPRRLCNSRAKVGSCLLFIHSILCTYHCKAGGGGRGEAGHGVGFDIFQKFAVKFLAHGQIIPVKCNQISPPRAAHCYQISQGRTQERHNENISK